MKRTANCMPLISVCFSSLQIRLKLRDEAECNRKSLLEVWTEVWVAVLEGEELMLRVTMLITTRSFPLAVQTSTPCTVSFTTSQKMKPDLIQSPSQNIIAVSRFTTEMKGPHPWRFNSASTAVCDILFYEILWTYFFLEERWNSAKAATSESFIFSSLTPKTKDCSTVYKITVLFVLLHEREILSFVGKLENSLMVCNKSAKESTECLLLCTH